MAVAAGSANETPEAPVALVAEALTLDGAEAKKGRGGALTDTRNQAGKAALPWLSAPEHVTLVEAPTVNREPLAGEQDTVEGCAHEQGQGQREQARPQGH